MLSNTLVQAGLVLLAGIAILGLTVRLGDRAARIPHAGHQQLAITVPYAGLPSPIQESGWSTGAFLAWGEEHLDELRAE